ncbi:HEAT repeat domain-containing protein [Sphingobacterium faecium]|uniref:HEAT repeat domain-containing protein n=1 Tax=Sphingobacterium faecium TaxID=34087 RepID=UPI001292A3AC|nr:HEAT repeat domain-containing protein [Sphingobacterium faecium]MQP29804.1 HEAT repeat domain-containing protein [Sphingobacterium faecium]
MNLKTNELSEKFKELITKPFKSNEDLELQEKIRIALEESLREDAAELVKELNSIGIKVNSVWDLVNTSERYADAIPILINHLKKDYHEKNIEGIIRALAVKEAVGKVTPYLITMYHQLTKDNDLLRWVIGNTIYMTITQDDVKSILPIVQDKTNGTSRQMFVAALGKIKSEEVEDVLINLLNDDEVVAQALGALGRIKSKKAKDKIAILTDHPRPLVRKEAQKALKKLMK